MCNSVCVRARLPSWIHCVIAKEGKRYRRCSSFHGLVLGGLGSFNSGWDWLARDAHLRGGEGMFRSQLLVATLAGTCPGHLPLLNSCVTAGFGCRLVVVVRTKAACPSVLRSSRASQPGRDRLGEDFLLCTGNHQAKCYIPDRPSQNPPFPDAARLQLWELSRLVWLWSSSLVLRCGVDLKPGGIGLLFPSAPPLANLLG